MPPQQGNGRPARVLGQQPRSDGTLSQDPAQAPLPRPGNQGPQWSRGYGPGSGLGKGRQVLLLFPSPMPHTRGFWPGLETDPPLWTEPGPTWSDRKWVRKPGHHQNLASHTELGSHPSFTT